MKKNWLLGVLLTIGILLMFSSAVWAATILYPELGTVEPELKYFTCTGTCSYGTAGEGFIGIQNGSTASVQFGGTEFHSRWGFNDVDDGSGHSPSAHVYIDGTYIKDCGDRGGPSLCDFTGLTPGIHTLTIQVNGGDSWQNVWMDWMYSSGQWDATPPTDPSFNNESHGITSGSATNITSPTITWNASTDIGTGVSGYQYYWGSSSSGTSTTSQVGTTITPTVSGDGTYYLRVRAYDGANNYSNWVTIFTYVLDTTPPPTPGMATDINGSSHDIWQHTVTAPSFTWAKPGDAVTYLVYFGTSSTGTSATQISTEAYTPTGPLSDGTYYLRLASQDSVGNTSAWGNSYIFRVDTLAPNITPYATSTNGALDSTWQNSPVTPAFTWATPTDSLSGYSGIRIYFGTDSSGSNTDTFANISSFTPSSSITSGTYYLRGQVIDRAGNQNAWRTMFVYQFDNTEPVWNANATEKSGAQIGTCQSNTTRPSFDWNSPANEAPITGYYIYWGRDSLGTSTDLVTDTSYLVPSATASGEHWFLRLSARDAAGNSDNWRTMFDFCYEEPVFIFFIIPTTAPTATTIPTPTDIPVTAPQAAQVIPTQQPTPMPTSQLNIDTNEPEPITASKNINLTLPDIPPAVPLTISGATLFSFGIGLLLSRSNDKKSVEWERLAEIRQKSYRLDKKY